MSESKLFLTDVLEHIRFCCFFVKFAYTSVAEVYAYKSRRADFKSVLSGFICNAIWWKSEQTGCSHAVRHPTWERGVDLPEIIF